MGAHIGVGVCTYNRPKHLDLFLSQIAKYNSTDKVPIFTDDSKERKGIAYRKNECLKELKDCDYIFLFDDDCLVLKEGWAEFFIEASKASGQQHFNYLHETPTIKFIKQACYQKHPPKLPPVMFDICIREYNNCAGCMMFLTKEVIEKVGGYGEYGIYGMEHAGYSQRINMAGLTPLGAYTCPAGAGEYIYSMDLDSHLPFNKQVNHEPSLKNELGNIRQYVSEGRKFYEKDLQQIYKPL